MIDAKIRAIAFDAVGTLIEPWPGVARAYGMAAAEQGVELAEDVIRGRFAKAFAKDDSASGHRTDEASERVRWRGIVAECLPELSAKQADAAFETLWDHFADARNWRLFPDAVDVLNALAGDGLKLCVASNFDSRLRQVWAGLTLAKSPLSKLVISSEVGVRKPGEGFYAAVTRVLELPPEEILFVGDDFENDFRMPRQMNFRTVLIDRRNRIEAFPKIESLRELLVGREFLHIRRFPKMHNDA